MLVEANHKTSCAWKGQASYSSLLVNGDMVRGRVAFGNAVKVA